MLQNASVMFQDVPRFGLQSCTWHMPSISRPCTLEELSIVKLDTAIKVMHTYLSLSVWCVASLVHWNQLSCCFQGCYTACPMWSPMLLLLLTATKEQAHSECTPALTCLACYILSFLVNIRKLNLSVCLIHYIHVWEFVIHRWALASLQI